MPDPRGRKSLRETDQTEEDKQLQHDREEIESTRKSRERERESD